LKKLEKHAKKSSLKGVPFGTVFAPESAKKYRFLKI
jgi:hypothetical protein